MPKRPAEPEAIHTADDSRATSQQPPRANPRTLTPRRRVGTSKAMSPVARAVARRSATARSITKFAKIDSTEADGILQPRRFRLRRLSGLHPVRLRCNMRAAMTPSAHPRAQPTQHNPTGRRSGQRSRKKVPSSKSKHHSREAELLQHGPARAGHSSPCSLCPTALLPANRSRARTRRR